MTSLHVSLSSSGARVLPRSVPRRYSSCLGSIGALAFVLGVGAAIASCPAVAFAETPGSGGSTSSGSPSSPAAAASSPSAQRSLSGAESAESDTGASPSDSPSADSRVSDSTDSAGAMASSGPGGSSSGSRDDTSPDIPADIATDIATHTDVDLSIDATPVTSASEDTGSVAEDTGSVAAADASGGSEPTSGLGGSDSSLSRSTSTAAPVAPMTADAAAWGETDAVSAAPAGSSTGDTGRRAGSFTRVGDDDQAGGDGVWVSSTKTAEPASSGTSQGKLITIFKGLHFSLPRQTQFFVRQVSGHATFTTDSIYDLDNQDQYDWNKLTGITFTPLRPDRNAIMVAWRYNVTSQMFEIGPYYNADLARIMPTPSEIISVPVGQQFEYSLDYDGITLRHGDQTVYKTIPERLSPNVWTALRINSWFGGTSVAPKTISYYLDLDPRSSTQCRWWCS